jgi:hypothetical protein
MFTTWDIPFLSHSGQLCLSHGVNHEFEPRIRSTALRTSFAEERGFIICLALPLLWQGYLFGEAIWQGYYSCLARRSFNYVQDRFTRQVLSIHEKARKNLTTDYTDFTDFIFCVQSVLIREISG